MRTTTRVRKRSRLIDLGRLAEAHLNWSKLGPNGWRQFMPWPSSLSLRVLWWTWNPQRRTVYTNLPGPVDTVTTYGTRRARGAVTTRGSRLVEPELEAWAVANIMCPRCGSRPGQGCETTPSRRPARCHMQRREMARTIRRYGPSATRSRWEVGL